MKRERDDDDGGDDGTKVPRPESSVGPAAKAVWIRLRQEPAAAWTMYASATRAAAAHECTVQWISLLCLGKKKSPHIEATLQDPEVFVFSSAPYVGGISSLAKHVWVRVGDDDTWHEHTSISSASRWLIDKIGMGTKPHLGQILSGKANPSAYFDITNQKPAS